MRLLSKRFFYILLAIIISAAVSALVTMSKMRVEASADSINALLYDLNNELDILIHLSENYASDSFLRKKAEGLVLGKLLAMSVTKPDISKLQGVPLDAIYRAIKYLKGYEWDSKEGKETFGIVRPYLYDIENVVSKLKSEKDEIFRKPLKGGRA